MIDVKEIRNKINTLKAEAQNLLDENKTEDAKAKSEEIKSLNAKFEEGVDELLTENSNLKEKYSNATDTIADLNDKVKKMQPIVDTYNREKEEEKLNKAKEEYKARFEKFDATELFEKEEVQELIKNTISEDEDVSKQAKYDLSNKLMEVIDNCSEEDLTINNIQEQAKETKNLNPGNDEFEDFYGFSKNK